MNNQNINARERTINNVETPLNYTNRLLSAPQLPLPIARYHYIDKMQLWMTKPLNSQHLRLIQRHSDFTHVETGCWWNWQYRQELQTHRPDPAALRILATLDDTTLLNYIEIAVDFTFDEAGEVQHWLDAFKDRLPAPPARSQDAR